MSRRYAPSPRSLRAHAIKGDVVRVLRDADGPLRIDDVLAAVRARQDGEHCSRRDVLTALRSLQRGAAVHARGALWAYGSSPSAKHPLTITFKPPEELP